MLLPLEVAAELSGVPHDLLSSLLEPVLLLGGEGDGDMFWLLVLTGNVTLGPCLPEVPACGDLDAGAAPAPLCLLVVTIVASEQTLK